MNSSSFNPYHITNRCPNREHFAIPLSDLWSIFEDYLFFISYAYEAQIHQFVLMPNHYHLVMSIDEKNLGPSMNYLNREVSKEINRRVGKINQNFGQRYYKCNIKSYHYFINVYKYVYQNPLRAGLVKQAEDWPYSSLRGLLGEQKILIPLVEDTILFNESVDLTLNWLNIKSSEEHLLEIRRGLKHSKFRLPRQRSNKTPSYIEKNLI